MSPSLPQRASIEHLRKQAKNLLKGQRTGDASACGALKHLQRFSDASDADILNARVALNEAQFAVALDYGFASWDRLRRHVRQQRLSDEATLEAVMLRCEQEIPEYAGAGVPLAVVAALNHAGVQIDFMEFAAATGWAFSFGYQYGDISPAFMAVRGNPRADGPAEVFAFLPTRLGYGYEMARIKNREQFWSFVQRHTDAGRPIISEHLDGGLISGCRQDDGRRQVCFDGTVAPGWTNIEDLQPFAVYVLVKKGEPMPPEELFRQALRRAVRKGSARRFRGVPQGMTALRAYLADVSDPAKDFESCAEWFCWAAFERLMARRCCEVWLGTVAETMSRKLRDHLIQAAAHYGKAFRHYDEYRSEVQAGEPTEQSLKQRARTPQRVRAIVPLLKDGIAAEAAGLSALRKAVRRLD